MGLVSYSFMQDLKIMTAYAIYRVARMIAESSIAALSQHLIRDRPTPNADPSRTGDNRILVGSQDPASDVAALLPTVGERTDAGRLRRKRFRARHRDLYGNVSGMVAAIHTARSGSLGATIQALA